MTTLRTLLTELPADTLLSDGGTRWTPNTLLNDMEPEELDSEDWAKSEYGNIVRVDKNGYLKGVYEGGFCIVEKDAE